MSFHTQKDFQTMSTALGAKLQTTAAQFSSSVGLKFDGSGLDQMTVSFDDIAKEALMFGANAWPDSARPEDPSPAVAIAGSRSLRPLMWTLASLLFTVPLGVLLVHTLGFGSSLAFATGVLAVALVFGTVNALLLSVVSPFASNLLFMPPALTWAVPTQFEIATVILYVVLAIAAPWLAHRAFRIRSALMQPVPQLVALKAISRHR